MLAENCKLGLNYSRELDEVYASLPSLTTYLEALAIDIRNDPEAEDAFAEVIEAISQGLHSMEREYRQEVISNVID